MALQLLAIDHSEHLAIDVVSTGSSCWPRRIERSARCGRAETVVEHGAEIVCHVDIFQANIFLAKLQFLVLVDQLQI